MNFTATSWCALTGQLVELATTETLRRRHNVYQDDVTEFIIYYAKPFAARHGLPVDKLEDYLSFNADYLLDMEDGAEPSTASLVAQVAGMDISTPDYPGFYAFVQANSQQKLVIRECEIDDDAMQGLDDFLVTIRGQF